MPVNYAPTYAETKPTPEPTQLPQADVIFLVQIPESTPKNKTVHFEIVDEITGIPFNSQRYATKRVDDTHVMVHMPLQLGDVVKYRYSLDNSPIQYEHGSDGAVIRYRSIVISGINTYLDQVISWDGENTTVQATGKIYGTVVDAASQQPIADVVVSLNGIQTISGANGAFVLENIPVGKHRVVLQESNGWYVPFQQEVIIADSAITPVDVSLTPRQKVKMTFILTVPGNVKNLPVRFIGDTYALGNLMSDQAAGMSVSASRAPFLVSDEKGNYRLSLELPAGMILRYKYSLGDGFWNAEHTQKGEYRIRQILIPSKDTEISDTVEQWNIGSNTPLVFTLRVPQDTPETDSISIQFKPFIWMPPLPMWSLGNGNWMYMLYSPLEWFKEMEYRYCRNDQCDETLTTNLQKITFGTQTEYNDNPNEWNGWIAKDNPDFNLADISIFTRPDSFIRGIAASSEYKPDWQPYINNGFMNMTENSANWVFFTPAWTVNDLFTPVMEPLPGMNPLAFDQYQMADWAKVNQLHIAVYPQLFYSKKSLANWLPDETDTGWWERWFNRYQSFLVHNAIVASRSGAEAIMLSDPLRNSPDLMSRIPKDQYQTKWLEAIQLVRENFKGKIFWAEVYKSPLEFPSFVDQLDFIYVSYQGNEKLFEISKKDLEKQIDKALDKEISKAVEEAGKPVVLGLSIPSGTGEQQRLQSQADIYFAFLSAVNSRDWITGFVTEGYHPAIVSQVNSTSIRGKLAEEVIQQYFTDFQAQKP